MLKQLLAEPRCSAVAYWLHFRLCQFGRPGCIAVSSRFIAATASPSKP